jgi:uncharacterized membrane protein YeaQ/YmgE (transglycosylase-associated protein family)
MGILSWLVMGLVAGILAKWIMPGKQGGGIFLTIVLGIMGAVVGGWVGSFLNLGTVERLDLRSMALAVGGAVIVLIAYRLIKGKTG